MHFLHGVAMTTVAVMQPYFFPYLGYFRLFAQSDIFVFFDCVQFPRRGYVHRNRMPRCPPDGSVQAQHWLTLPLSSQPQETEIRGLRFALGTEDTWNARIAAFPWLVGAGEVYDMVRSIDERAPVVDYLIETLLFSAAKLGVQRDTVRSSELSVPQHVRGQARVIEIVKRLGGTRYINAPGGRELYDESAFHDARLSLSFLPPFKGSLNSLIYELSFSKIDELKTAVVRLDD